MNEPPPERTALASALAEGTTTVGRSHRLHRRRGGFCARGYCQQCPLADGDGRLACDTPGDARSVRSGPDPLRIAGMLGERMEPWFYERRFLRPAWLRQPFLGVLRRLSAAPPLPTEGPVAGRPSRRYQTDVVVVGGGPAGMAAAAEIAPETATTVITRGRSGGSLRMTDAVRAAARDDVERVRRAGGEVLEHTFCLGLYEGDGGVVAIGPDGPVVVEAARIVVATGAYDRVIPVPGADLPGVIGLRAFEVLAPQGAFGAASRVGVVGPASEVRRAVAASAAAGVPLAWVQEQGPERAARAVVAVRGRSRVRQAVFDDGTSEPTDVLVIGYTQPTYELQLQNGRRPVFAGSPLVVRTEGAGRLPMLVVGEAAGWREPDAARMSAAEAARTWVAGAEPPPEAISPTVWLEPQREPEAPVCLCEDVRVRDVDRALEEGFGDIELLKRRSGVGTGACQGKLCLAVIAELLAARGIAPGLPTVRPPIRPVNVAALGGDEG